MGESRIHCETVPEDYGWGVLAGIEEASHLLKDLNVTVRAMKEGTLFRAYELSWR